MTYLLELVDTIDIAIANTVDLVEETSRERRRDRRRRAVERLQEIISRLRERSLMGQAAEDERPIKLRG
jgi:hypothetical protein